MLLKLENSPVQTVSFQSQSFLVKRDDLLHADFSGNKARKLHYFLVNEFPGIDTLISHGSIQSNAMYSLSVLCRLKNWTFIYYVDHIPSLLKETPVGNYRYALNNGMELRVFTNNQGIADIDYDNNTCLLIHEGGANQEAQYGLKILASETRQYKKDHNINKLKLFLPSGTGTTALYLQKYLDDEVITCPCVGDATYLKKQFLMLEKDDSIHPTIVPGNRKYHFGKLYADHFSLWKALKDETDIEFDLLYDPIGMEIFLALEKDRNFTYMYIHQGGIKGNETMISRYRFKGISKNLTKMSEPAR